MYRNQIATHDFADLPGSLMPAESYNSDTVLLKNASSHDESVGVRRTPVLLTRCWLLSVRNVDGQYEQRVHLDHTPI